jgi:succinoglycan biosynthesis protein ExoM
VTASRPSIVVAMLTYLRHDDLPLAVDGVLGEAALIGADVTLLVVDNDPSASAMTLADRWTGERVRFVHEPTPGIPAARNRALDEAASADVLVFIDDDERPQEGWLRSLIDTWKRTAATAVAGPVVSTFSTEPDPWIIDGGFFSRRRFPTGTEVAVAATNNLLIDVAEVRRLGVRFDVAYGQSGGSDTLFTRQLHRRGGRLVWCQEAVVIDVVPPGRLTRRWVTQRALRLGNSWSRVALALEDRSTSRMARRFQLTASGLTRTAGGALRIALGVVARSRVQRARGTKTLARGLGMTSGAWGYTYHEYRRP